jgi:hypothetical protein
LLEFLQFVLLFEEVFAGSVALLLQRLFLGQVRFGDALVSDFLCKLGVAVGEGQVGILQPFEFLFRLVYFSTQFIALPL